MWVVVEQYFFFPLLYLFVILEGVALPWDNDKTRGDNLALFHNQSDTVELPVDSLEQLVVCPALCQRILVFPPSFLVGNIIAVLVVKKVLEKSSCL